MVVHGGYIDVNHNDMMYPYKKNKLGATQLHCQNKYQKKKNILYVIAVYFFAIHTCMYVSIYIYTHIYIYIYIYMCVCDCVCIYCITYIYIYNMRVCVCVCVCVYVVCK